MRLVKNKEDLEVKAIIDIAPLIDCVFLLLIYFMVTASLVKKEGDISFVLPADVSQTEPVNLPVEAQIEIAADGTVGLDGLRFPAQDRIMDGLALHLRGLNQMALSQNALFSVNLLPSADTVHGRIIEVMDACAAGGVKNLTFSKAM